MEIIEWFVNNHVQFSKRLEIKESPLGGTGVFATGPISTDDILLCVPKKVVLSPKTCGIANILVDYELDPMQAVVIAYIFEKHQPHSPWKLFIDSIEKVPLPDVPRLWPEEHQNLLKHCDIQFAGGLDKTQFEAGFSECRDFFEDQGLLKLELEEYTDAILRVSSRAFDVDNFHELALVPGACLFNHSDENNVRFETDGQVCSMCGAQACGCVDSDESGSENEDDDVASVASATSVSSNGTALSNSSSTSSVDMENVCEIRAIKPIKSNQEVFNTYGDDGNSALLARYGFVIPHNSHEVVDITRDMFQYSKRNNCKDRYSYWKKHFAEFVEEDELDEDAWRDALFIDSSGEVSGPAALLATVFSLSDKAYKKFTKTGEYSLKSDEPVKEILLKVLESRLVNYRDGGMSSQKYFNKAKEVDWPFKAILELIGTEKEVVERAIEDVSGSSA